MQVELVRSGDGESFYLPAVRTQEEAKKQIDDLEARFQEWNPDVPIPENDPLSFYEGCDVYLYDAENRIMYELDDEEKWVKSHDCSWPEDCH
jgi:hypothetical protein